MVIYLEWQDNVLLLKNKLVLVDHMNELKSKANGWSYVKSFRIILKLFIMGNIRMVKKLVVGKLYLEINETKFK